MAKLIKMDTDKLNSDMISVSERIESIRSTLNYLEEQAGVLDGMWNGPGSDAFKKAFHSDLMAMQTVIGNLEDLNRYEEKAYGKFQRCGIDVRAAIDEIRI